MIGRLDNSNSPPHELANSQSSTSLPSLSIPLTLSLNLHEDTVLEASLSSLLNTFGAETMKIYNAILGEKRVIFLGYQQPASRVCTLSVSACLLVSPPVLGVLKRCVPYASLTSIESLLKVIHDFSNLI